MPDFSQCVEFERFGCAKFECHYTADMDSNLVYFERVDFDGLILSNRQIAEAWGRAEIDRLEAIGQTYWDDHGYQDEIAAQRERNEWAAE